jgi:cytochrome d ubiquinol oxidase subunit II
VTLDLPLIWAGVVALAVLVYVVLDGFDLGIGILFPFVKSESGRDRMMNSVAPVWDGNQTWLVLGGGGLFAAFPLAYAVIMPALYAPIVVMLLALIFRGVAFEYRFKTRRAKFLWDASFAGGSIIATFAQGVALGALVQGIPVAGRAYAGGWWDWLTAFSVLTGIALVVGYALLGATWLVYKTEGELQGAARRFAWIAGTGTLALIGIVSLWTPFLNENYMARWFRWPQIFYVIPVPLLVGACAIALLRGLSTKRQLVPFLASLGLFILSFVGLLISFYPYIVPSSVTIWNGAAPDESLSFLLVGAAVLLPLIMLYTIHAYWVFRGKVRVTGGYH